MGLPDDDAVAGSLAQCSSSRVVQQLKSQSNLAVLLVNTDRRDEAEPIYREVLAARRRTLGEEHADTLRSMHNLARCRYDQAQAARARCKWLEAATAYHEAAELGAKLQSRGSDLSSAKAAVQWRNWAETCAERQRRVGTIPVF